MCTYVVHIPSSPGAHLIVNIPFPVGPFRRVGILESPGWRPRRAPGVLPPQGDTSCIPSLCPTQAAALHRSAAWRRAHPLGEDNPLHDLPPLLRSAGWRRAHLVGPGRCRAEAERPKGAVSTALPRCGFVGQVSSTPGLGPYTSFHPFGPLILLRLPQVGSPGPPPLTLKPVNPEARKPCLPLLVEPSRVSRVG